MVVQVASWDEGPFLRVFTSFRAHCGLIISLLLSTMAVWTRGRCVWIKFNPTARVYFFLRIDKAAIIRNAAPV